MCDEKRLKEIIENKEDFVVTSEIQIRQVQKEGNRIEKEVMDLTKQISILL